MWGQHAVLERDQECVQEPQLPGASVVSGRAAAQRGALHSPHEHPLQGQPPVRPQTHGRNVQHQVPPGTQNFFSFFNRHTFKVDLHINIK